MQGWSATLKREYSVLMKRAVPVSFTTRWKKQVRQKVYARSETAMFKICGFGAILELWGLAL